MAFFQEAGHARVLMPVLQRLAELPQEFEVRVIGHREALPALSESDLRFRDAKTMFSIPLTDDQARAYLDAVRPDLVLIGPTHPYTIAGDMSALTLLTTAKRTARPTLSILDHWQGLDRFGAGSRAQDAYAPAYLGVMDEWSREQLRRTLKQTHIEIVGHPYLEQVRHQAGSPDRAAQRARCRERYGISPDDTVWVIVSQHLVSRDEPCERKSLLDLQCGRRGLVQGIRELAHVHAERSGRSVRVVCRSHPKEASRPAGLDASEQWLAEASSADTILLADLLIGWDSMMLIEGYFAGIAVLSLCFLAEEYAKVDLARLGIGGHCKTWEDIEQWILNADERVPHYVVTAGHEAILTRATERVEQLVRHALMKQRWLTN